MLTKSIGIRLVRYRVDLRRRFLLTSPIVLHTFPTADSVVISSRARIPNPWQYVKHYQRMCVPCVPWQTLPLWGAVGPQLSFHTWQPRLQCPGPSKESHTDQFSLISSVSSFAVAWTPFFTFSTAAENEFYFLKQDVLKCLTLAPYDLSQSQFLYVDASYNQGFGCVL